ncbi:type I polyketide synthase [Anaeromicropila populeti]|uniref:Phosphopantetheine attachment site n=1 Tax=Anaeromicropila populeti TaxID=37658 RepID=A0A1I6IZM5_9FIRM|nr:type I polyketide synthase [Anaeromicropila populeti]SFR72206.1 Phosphopantetheine attachment site [Anaeromicropila populeti]
MRKNNRGRGTDIAIVGMACQFPKAKDYNEFWDNIIKGKDCIEEIKRWNNNQFYSENYDDNKSISKWMGHLDDIQMFDNNFFNISPKEANEMDPQQRILLENTWKCIEDSGISLKCLQKNITSVYVSALNLNSYFDLLNKENVGVFTGNGNYPFMLSNRISYFFDLKGDSKVIDTGCSGALIATYDAQRSLINKDSDYALVESINICIEPLKYIIWSKNRMLSGDGRCKTFDKDANGFVMGEGVGVLLLQRLDDAIRDNNHIYGVIKGCAVGHGGHANTITSPSVEIQKSVIRKAYQDAQCSVEDVTYIETHGTGTSLGDPIEIEALKQVFREDTEKKQYCELGSVKTNIGHLLNAAGMASIIKVLLMFKYKKIPPLINFKMLNPMIEFDESSFFISTDTKDWKCEEKARLAGITAIGLGGSNSHLVIQEYVAKTMDEKTELINEYPFILSAKTENSLEKIKDKWLKFIKNNGVESLALKDICMTQLLGRENFKYRVGGMVSTIEDISNMLERHDNTPISDDADLECMFIARNIKLTSFSVNSSLFKEHQVFNRLEMILKMTEEISTNYKRRKDFYNGTWKEIYVNLNNFILQYSVISGLKELGVRMDQTTGEGTGVWISLALSEILSVNQILCYLLDQIKLSQLKPVCGNMTFYDPINQNLIKPFCFNASYLHDLLHKAELPDEAFLHYSCKAKLLYENQFTFRKYADEWNDVIDVYGSSIKEIIYNSHSSYWNEDNIQEKKFLFVLIIASSLIKLNKKWNISEDYMIDNEKFNDLIHLLNSHKLSRLELITLLFGKQEDYEKIVKTCLDKRGFEKNILSEREDYKYLFKFSKKEKVWENFEDWLIKVLKEDFTPIQNDLLNIEFVVEEQEENVSLTRNYKSVKIRLDHSLRYEIDKCCVQLWLTGQSIKWDVYYRKTDYKKVSLPVYSFEQKKFWAENQSICNVNSNDLLQENSNCTIELGKNIEREPVFVHKEWEKKPYYQNVNRKESVIIVATEDTLELAKLIQKQMKLSHIILYSNNEFVGVQNLSDNLGEGIIDVTGCGTTLIEEKKWIAVIQAALNTAVIKRKEMRFLCISKGLEIFQNSKINMAGAIHAGLFRMIQNEYKGTSSCHVDFAENDLAKEMAPLIIKEYFNDSRVCQVCYRNKERFQSYFNEISLKNEQRLHFNREHALWITGGTRGIGYLAAIHFAKNYGVQKFVLTGREEIPPKNQWSLYGNTPIGKKIAAIKELEQLGAQVITLATELTDNRALRTSLEEVKKQFGFIGGVIHCAGITDERNPAFIRKNVDEIQLVLNPKVQGTENLFQVLKDEPLQFFVLYSSVSAAIPSLSSGQSDYAMANTYLDYFACSHYKKCAVVSIQWPSWSMSGMGEVKNKAYLETGLLSHTNNEGLYLLDKIISQKISNLETPVIMPAYVNFDKWKLKKLLNREALHMADNVLVNELSSFISKIFMEELSLEAQDIDYDIMFQELGVDSIILAQIVKRMENSLEGIAIDPAVILEYPNIRQLSEFLLETYPDKIKTALTSCNKKNQVKQETDGDLEKLICNIIAEELGVEKEDIDVNEMFENMGIDSIFLQQIIKRFDRELQGIKLAPDVFFEYRTIKELADYLSTNYEDSLGKKIEKQVIMPKEESAIVKSSSRCNKKVAVIGMACHFPDAPDIQTYWSNLVSKKDSICIIPKERFDWEKRYYPNEFKKGNIISKWGGFLKDIEYFDAEYFKVKESLAKNMDPLQRQWLEVSVEALADAGYSKKQVWGQDIGVFCGARVSTFHNKIKQDTSDTIVGIGQNFIATHLSHFLNLKGPNMVIDTACSSSLTAIHLAAQSILSGESDMAFAGGVEILEESIYELLSAAKILSPDGRCKTFDANANGIGIGEGCGVLILKELNRAIDDNNKIYGVIDGSALNNDGNTMGITTPSPEQQRELIQKAIKNAKIDPTTISYVETHGTGTLIGDPIELKGLNTVFKSYTDEKHFCGVGSVKSNIGHLLSASGAASIIKVLLSIINSQLPATINCDNPNTRFAFEDSSLYIVHNQVAWNERNNVLRAGISGFGLGGDNAHIIVSNEGIPKQNIATMQSLGEKITFNRKRFWIDEETEIIRKESSNIQSELNPFSDFFGFKRVN